MRKKFFVPLDIVIYSVIIFCAVLLFCGFYTKNQGAKVTIFHDGVQIFESSLDEEKKWQWKVGKDFVKIAIEKGMVRVIDSSCPDQTCVHTGKIEKKGQSIICLPNRILIQISGVVEKKGVDAVAG